MNTKYHQTEGFKFNPAGLIGLDAGTKASISKHLRTREREINTIETDVITCDGGPFNGQQIEMQAINGKIQDNRTIDFVVGKWKGYYKDSKWVSTLSAEEPEARNQINPPNRAHINADLPAKGFDQLRAFFDELSENLHDRETHTKEISKNLHQKFVTYKLGRTTYTIPANKQAVERLAAKVLKIKRFCSDKVLNMPKVTYTEKMSEADARSFKNYFMPAAAVAALWEYRARMGDTQEANATPAPAHTMQAQPEPVATIAAVEIKQPAKPLDSATETLSNIDDFLTGKHSESYNPLKMANAKKALHQQTRVDGGPIIKVHEFIENIAKLGAKTRFLQVPKIKPLSRMADFRATNEQQKAHELKMKQAGTKAEYMFGAYQVNKTSYEYALFLEAKHAKNAAIEVAPKTEQPAKPLATTCNADALRLRSKAALCRAANRPTWAEKLEAQADALERMDPPEPPPGNKATPANGKPKPQKCKHGTLHKIKAQRPHKTACIRLAKIRHPAKQKYGQPFRQNFNEAMAERLISNGHEPPAIKLTTPPGIKTVTPPGNFYNPTQAKTHATPTI